MVTTEKVAKLIVDFNYDSIPERGIKQSKAAIIDSIGAGLLGYREPVGQAMTQVVSGRGGEPEARLWATGQRTSLLNAALINSVCLHAMDYDNGGSLGHPAAVMIPPALALGEKYKLSGKKIIEAYAVAYELGARLRNSLGDLQFGAGFHATALLGVICSAAESAKLMGLDLQKTRMAMSIATSLSSGMLQSFGWDSKPIQVARAAESGVLAALLAREGSTGDPYIFEESKGFYYVYGQEEASIKQLTENFGKPLAVAAERGHFKQWACCGGNYEVLSALYDLLAGQDIPADQITEIVVATSMTPPGPAFRLQPRTPMEGRFSITYNIASCLIDGFVNLNTFSAGKFNRPEVHELMNKIQVIQHPECAGKPRRLQGESRFVTIDIRLRDGRLISKRQEAANRKQLADEEIYVKFAENARSTGLAEDKIAKAVERVKSLENCDDVTELIDLIC
ncbi:MmgE/PrpD family protein [Desulfosporosinus sp. PR]|uniref:MmgE/PrpD family protein n=1 Tax=Candidatus Desulfosporosinus nitrosoreducens TaxID=3401928 RepID=UPI0027F2CDC9|nr:MmgE/PrpD family protein [Desulfosporosinus sp. PR]MDQ7096536.1 MmgE/PrpD family protein [Desulfosporosinus sp. PR]